MCTHAHTHKSTYIRQIFISLLVFQTNEKKILTLEIFLTILKIP